MSFYWEIYGSGNSSYCKTVNTNHRSIHSDVKKTRFTHSSFQQLVCAQNLCLKITKFVSKSLSKANRAVQKFKMHCLSLSLGSESFTTVDIVDALLGCAQQ